MTVLVIDGQGGGLGRQLVAAIKAQCPGVWVLAAITVGGGMLGIVGMLLSVPIVATLYRLLQSDIRQRSGKERAKKSDVSPKE